MSPSRSRRFSGPLAVALLAVVLVTGLGVVSFVRALDSFQPLGFEARRSAGGWTVVSVSASAREEGPGRAPDATDAGGRVESTTGLRAGDQILLAGGTEVGNLEQSLGRTLRQQPRTDLVVLRDGALTEVVYRRPPLAVDWSYLVLALIGTLYLLIGVYTVLRERRSEAILFYLWCLASAGVYMVTPSGLGDTLGRGLYVAEEVARALLPPLTLHLFLVFPGPLRSARFEAGDSGRPSRGASRPGGIRWIPFLYLPAAALLTLQLSLVLFAGRGIDPAWAGRALPVLDRATLVHLVLYALLALGVLIFRLGRRRDWQEQRQLQWIAVGLGAGYVPFLALYVVPYTLGADLPGLLTALAVFPLAVVPLTFAWAILRYRLWDIAVVVRETVSTTLTVLLAGAAFALAHMIVSRTLPEDLGLVRDFFSFGSGAVIAGMLLPARRRVGSALERLQYGRAMAKRRALQRLGRDLLTERSLDRLCSDLLTDLCDGLELEVANLYLVERSGTLKAVARDARGLPGGDPGAEPDRDAPERLDLDELGPELWRREVEALTGVSFATQGLSPRQRLFLAGYRYAFPLTVRGQPVGLLVTGFRLGELPLSSDDLELVQQLAGSAALAIENARLLEELEDRLEEVLELQSFNAGIIESSPAGIAVLDPEGSVLTANAAFAALVETDSTELPGAPVEDLLAAEPLPEPGEGLIQISYADRRGEERHLQLSSAAFQPAGTEDPSEALRVLLVHDVSERVAMEKALREKDRLAALGILAAGVAHEVNTPITGISSYAQMLLSETPEDDPRYEILKKVEKQTFRAARIVNNLLEFARNRTDEIRPVDLVPLVDEGLDLLNERRSKRRIRLELDLPDEPLVVRGSDGELQQVVTNLALNAIDAMPHGGTLTVTGRATSRWAEVVVADTGEGIEAEALDRIFEPFYSTKVGRGGTGLGLSISHDIVRRHGGTVDVDSEPGRGTRFTVRLPLDREAVEPGRLASGGASGEDPAGPTTET